MADEQYPTTPLATAGLRNEVVPTECPECTRPIRAGVDYCPWCKHHLGKIVRPVPSAIRAGMEIDQEATAPLSADVTLDLGEAHYLLAWLWSVTDTSEYGEEKELMRRIHRALGIGPDVDCRNPICNELLALTQRAEAAEAKLAAQEATAHLSLDRATLEYIHNEWEFEDRTEAEFDDWLHGLIKAARKRETEATAPQEPEKEETDDTTAES